MAKRGKSRRNTPRTQGRTRKTRAPSRTSRQSAQRELSANKKQLAKMRREIQRLEKKITRATRSQIKETKTRLETLDTIFERPIKRPRRGASKRDERNFAMRILSASKKLGLTKSRRRTAKATDPLIQRLWKDYKGVLQGKEIPVRVSERMRRQMKRAGARTEKGKVFLKAETKAVKLARVRTVKLPLQYKSMPQYLEDLKSRRELEKLLPPNGAWAFRVFGHDSYNSYATLNQMADDFLRRYQTVQLAMSRPQRGEQWVSKLVYLQVAPKSWAGKQRKRAKRGKRVR